MPVLAVLTVIEYRAAGEMGSIRIIHRNIRIGYQKFRGARTMNTNVKLNGATVFRSAFGVAPNAAAEAEADSGDAIGIYDWRTPDMAGFALPETDELVVALHLGGSQNVRAVTDGGLSRSCSKTGMVTVLPPGRSVAFNTAGSIEVMTLHIPLRGRLTSHIEPNLLAGGSMARFAFRDAYVIAAMEALLRAARASRSPSPMYLTKLADALLCHIAQMALASQQAPTIHDAATAPPEASMLKIGDKYFSDLIGYIESRLGQQLPIDELAAYVGVSRAVFTRSFRTALGTPVHQYVTQRRVAAAMRLLKSSELDLAWIAQETGFSSQSHFTDTFHALTGSTPRRFRDQR